MLIGYARISTVNQDLSLQIDALQKVGCEKIFQEIESGVSKKREQFNLCQAALRKGDTLVVWALDRLGRSNKDLINIISSLKDQGVDFWSLKESIHLKQALGATANSTGEIMLAMYSVLAEAERNRIKERIIAGMHAARKRGMVGGRRPKLNESKAVVLRELYYSKNCTLKHIQDTLGICEKTIYNYIYRHEKKQLKA